MKKIIWLLFVVLMATVVIAQFPYPSQTYHYYWNFDPVNPFGANNIYNLDNTTGTGLIDAANDTWNLYRRDVLAIRIENTDWTSSTGLLTRFNQSLVLNQGTTNEAINISTNISQCEGWAFSGWLNTTTDVTGTAATLLGSNGGQVDFFAQENADTLYVELGVADGGQRITTQFNRFYEIVRNTPGGSSMPQHFFLIKAPGCSVGARGIQLYLNGTNYTDITYGLSETLTNSSIEFLNNPLFFGARAQGSVAVLGWHVQVDDLMVWRNDQMGQLLGTSGNDELSSKVLTIYNGNYTNATIPADTTKPNITLINFTSDGGSACNNASVTPYPSVCANTSDGTPTFVITTSENAAVRGNITEANYADMGTNATPNDFSTTSLTWTQPYNLDEGRYVFYFTALDAAGNNQTTPLPENFKANLTINYAPQVNFSFVRTTRNGTIADNFIQINITANDTLGIGNISLALYNLTDKVFFNSTIADQKEISLFSNITNLPETNYTINGTAIDIANAKNITLSRTITIDRTAPSIDYASPTPADNAELFSSYLNISVSARDIHLVNITIILYNSTNSTINSYTLFGSANYSLNLSLADGSYYFNVTAYDIVGNRNGTVARRITFDNSAPKINWTLPILYDGTHTFDFIYVNVTANTTILKNITIWLYNSSRDLINVSSSLNNSHFKNFTDLNFGTYYLNATVYDNNEKKNSTSTRTYIIQPDVSINISITNTSIRFLVNGSSFLHAINQNSTQGILNLSNNGNFPVIFRMKINFTNNPFQQFLIDSDFYNWTTNRNQSTNATWNYTHFCSGFVPANNLSTAGNIAGRLQYRFRNNMTYQAFNGSDWINNSVLFDCPQYYELRKEIKYNITGNYSNLSLDVRGDASNNTLHFYINTTFCANLTLQNTSWNTIRCNLHSTGKPFNLTINITNVSSIVTNVSTIYFDNLFYFNNSIISDYVTFSTLNSSNESARINLTSDYQTIFTLPANNQSYVWVWAELKRARLPLGLLYEILTEFQHG